MAQHAMVQSRAAGNAAVVADAEVLDLEASPEVEVTAIVPHLTTRAINPFRRKARSMLDEQSFEDAKVDADKNLESAETNVAKVIEKQVAAENAVQDSWKEFEKAQEEVTAKIDLELQAAKAFGQCQLEQKNKELRLQQMREELFKKKKELAMMEIMQMNEAEMKKMQEQRKQAEQELQRFKQQQKELRIEHRKLEKGRIPVVLVSDDVEMHGGSKRQSDTQIEEPPEKRQANAESSDVGEDGANDNGKALSEDLEEHQPVLESEDHGEDA